MYRQLQEKVKEYIIGSLCEISDDWIFDIDMTNIADPIIVGTKSNGMEIRTRIEKFHDSMPKELIAGMKKVYGSVHSNKMKIWGGLIMMRYWICRIIPIYGINKVQSLQYSIRFNIMDKNKERSINSYIYGIHQNTNDNIYFTSPFREKLSKKLFLEKELMPSLVLILDPISYFRRCEIIIEKYPELQDNCTTGIYDILLEYFPEMNGEFLLKYWAINYVFSEVCCDIVFLVGSVLLELYRY